MHKQKSIYMDNVVISKKQGRKSKLVFLKKNNEPAVSIPRRFELPDVDSFKYKWKGNTLPYILYYVMRNESNCFWGGLPELSYYFNVNPITLKKYISILLDLKLVKWDYRHNEHTISKRCLVINDDPYKITVTDNDTYKVRVYFDSIRYDLSSSRWLKDVLDDLKVQEASKAISASDIHAKKTIKKQIVGGSLKEVVERKVNSSARSTKHNLVNRIGIYTYRKWVKQNKVNDLLIRINISDLKEEAKSFIENERELFKAKKNNQFSFISGETLCIYLGKTLNKYIFKTTRDDTSHMFDNATRLTTQEKKDFIRENILRRAIDKRELEVVHL